MEKKRVWKNKRWIAAVAIVVCAVISGRVFMKPTTVSVGDLTAKVTPKQIVQVMDLSKGNEAVTSFGVHLFQRAMVEGENTLISPLSVLCALAMTANGAEGETLSQMEQVLGMKPEELNPYLYTYMAQLPQNKKYQLKLANSIWFSDVETFQVEQDFLQTNADYYGAQIYKRTFDAETVDDINAWVKKKTNDMIPMIIDQLPEDAVMYLINALAFEAEWGKVYEEEQVRDGIFTLEDGTEQKIKLMYSEENVYLEDELATGMVKYYKDGEYAFVALLPKEGVSVAEYVNSLSGVQVRELLANASKETVLVAIPEFEAEYSTELKKALTDMGMPIAFHSEDADFSGLGHSTRPEGNIFISRVLHKTFISVDSKGTKAAAVTAVEATENGGSAYVINPKVVYLDRPFVYMLIDTKNNLPFFIGTLMAVS